MGDPLIAGDFIETGEYHRSTMIYVSTWMMTGGTGVTLMDWKPPGFF